MGYVMKLPLPGVPFDIALERTRQALAAEGFGIPTEMDTQELFRLKLQKESPARVILGACFATVAYEALQQEPDLAALLPCNVVVMETKEGSEVTAVRPTALFSLTQQSRLDHATAVEQHLKAVLDALVV